MNEERLLKGIQKKKESYLEEAIDTYGRLVYTVITKFLPEEEEAAKELVSDVFVELWNNAERIDLERGSLKNMLCLIARSRALNYKKKHSKVEVISFAEEYMGHRQGLEHEVIEKENVKELLEKVRQLKEPASTILIMRYFQNLSVEEIAQKLAMKRSQVDNHLSRGRKRLRSLIEQIG